MIHTTGSNKNDEIMKLRWGEPIMSVYHWSRSIKQCVPGQTRPCEQTVDHQTKCLGQNNIKGQLEWKFNRMDLKKKKEFNLELTKI